MPFSRARVPWLIFGSAVVALFLIAAAADSMTARLATSDSWVAHTHEVETEVAELRSEIFSAESSRLGYIVTRNTSHLDLYEQAQKAIPSELNQLAELTKDNPTQQERIAEMRPLIDRRLGMLQQSFDLRQRGATDTAAQIRLAEQGETLRNQVLSILQTMQTEEEELLEQRETVSARAYRNARLVWGAVFLAVLLLLALNFKRLLAELRDRTQAEEAVRSLSAKILQVQDAERRRIARELHDSIGQIFAALKMNLSTLGDQDAALDQDSKSGVLASSLEFVDQGLTECRTLSHLLHPPLLEDLGFSSAAKWLVDGFSKRSGIAVDLKMPADLPRLPQDIELTLFRVLQEALTNVHRHSGSASAVAEIRLIPRGIAVVRDCGRGIPPGKLQAFKRSRAGIGVGLAGMRERVHEVGGNLELESNGSGTTLRVSMPFSQGGPLNRRVSVQESKLPLEL